MPSEDDLQLLETLLDGELGTDEADALRARLAADPALAEACQRLRRQRDMRQLIWRAMEPHEATVNRFLAAMQRRIHRDELWRRRLGALRYVSGLAACIALGFLIGRFVPYAPMGDRGNGVVFEAERGPVQEVMGTAAPSRRPSGFKVLLTDANNTVIAEQWFDTFNEAREFTEDLSRAQNRYRGVRQPPPQQHQQPLRGNETFFIKGEF